MRIGIDCRSLEGQKTGVGVYLSNLMQHIIKLADESIRFICYFENEIPSVFWLNDKRIEAKIIKLPVQNNLFWSSIRLPFELVEDRVDLFHSPSYTTPFFKLKKTIVTIHDISYAANPEWYPYKSDYFRRYYYHRSAKSADIILTGSEFSKNEIIKYYGIDEWKVKVIYYGLDKRFIDDMGSKASNSVLNKYGIFDDYILYVGNLHYRRNLERLIEAFITLKNENKIFETLKLVIVGKDEGSLNKLLSLYSSRSDLIFTDYVEDEDIPELYRQAKCLALLSFYEGLGFPILESMASGTPSVVSDIEVFREIFKDNCLFVNPYDINEITQAIFNVLTNNELYRDLSVKGKTYASSFDWENTARKTLDQYLSCA